MHFHQYRVLLEIGEAHPDRIAVDALVFRQQ